MMVLSTPPRTRSEVADLMYIALDESTRDLMVSGSVPDAVAAALANCLRAIEMSRSMLRSIKTTKLRAGDDRCGPVRHAYRARFEISKLDKVWTSLLSSLTSLMARQSKRIVRAYE